MAHDAVGRLAHRCEHKHRIVRGRCAARSASSIGRRSAAVGRPDARAGASSCACPVCSQCSRAKPPTAPTCVVLPTASARYCAVSASPHSVDRFDVLPKGTARGIQYRSTPTRSKSRSFSRGSIDTAVRASLWPPVRRQCRISRATCGELPLVSTESTQIRVLRVPR